MTTSKLIRNFGVEKLIVEPWGENSLRVRVVPMGKINENKGALLDADECEAILLEKEDGTTELQNGKIRVVLDNRERLVFYNEKNEILLKEFIRLRAVQHDDGSEDVGTVKVIKAFNSTLKLKAREFKANAHGADFSVKVRFESEPTEKIYGMGQYQLPFLDLKNTVLELAQRNTQMSIPFYVSSLNYGFLWNNPGIGEVKFAKNLTEWSMPATTYVDYWITVGDNPKMILKQYTSVTGRAPVMPKKLLGLWQSKLRYRTPEDVLMVLEEYKKREIQLSTIAIDYFHWKKQGEYSFDRAFWPTPEKLIKTIKENNVEPIISIWPTVQTDAENFLEYQKNGYLINVNRGVPISMQIQGQTIFVDTTNEEACRYVWSLIDKNYKKIGIDYYWIDVAEPGYSVYDFDNYMYSKGPVLHCGNLYPMGYLKMIYDGNGGSSIDNVILVRGAWAGAQRYGALPWSGDVDSSFKSLKNQINTGLNVGMAGIPWWTTDIGGFHGGDAKDPEFVELMIRWFQYATFSPVLRMHGDRLPHVARLSNSGGGSMPSGSPNEIWSFGKTAEKIMTQFIRIRELLKDYLFKLMKEANQTGSPIMRTLFYEFPDDMMSWDIDYTYMFGDAILVAPVHDYRSRKREVYLPGGEQWINIFSGEILDGGNHYVINSPIEIIPVFIKERERYQFSDLINYTANLNK